MLIPQAIVETSAADSFWDATVRKGTDESISGSTSMQDDDELLFSVIGATPYFFELILLYDTPSTADFKHEFTLSAGVVTRGWRQHMGFGATTIVSQAGQVADMSTVIQIAGNSGESLLQLLRGFILPSTNATFNFRWAQNSSDPGNTTVKAGSTISWRAMI